MLVEERDRALPRQGGRGHVEARGRVVVEPVLRTRIGELLIARPVRLERRLVGRPSRVDAVVVLGVMNQQRRRDLGHILRPRLAAVERGGRVDVATQLHRQVVDDTAAEAEADGAEAPGTVGSAAHVARRGEEIGHHHRLLQRPLHLSALFVGARVAAE